MIRAQRLSGRRRFEAVRSEGVGARGALVRVRARHRGGSTSCAGISVRGSRTAVARNRARRRLNAALAGELGRCPGFDLIVYAEARDIATAGYDDLVSDVRRTLERATRRLTEAAR